MAWVEYINYFKVKNYNLGANVGYALSTVKMNDYSKRLRGLADL